MGPLGTKPGRQIGMGLGVGGGAAVATQPPVAGYVLWLDASDPATLFQDAAKTTPITADGQAIGAWADKSGNGSDATQGTAALKPTYKTGIQNSLPVARFASDYLNLPNAFGALSAAEIFIVIAAVADPPAGEVSHWCFGSDGNINYYTYFGNGFIYDQFGTTARKTTVNPTPSLTAWHIYSIVSRSGEWTSRLDGTQIYTTGTNTVGWETLPKLGAGNRFGSGAFIGDMGEVLMYGSVLGSSDRASTLLYLKTKWGTP